jgi:hypothetical protein
MALNLRTLASRLDRIEQRIEERRHRPRDKTFRLVNVDTGEVIQQKPAAEDLTVMIIFDKPLEVLRRH